MNEGGDPLCARVFLAGPPTQVAGPFSAPKTHMQIFSSHEWHMPRSLSLPKRPDRAPTGAAAENETENRPSYRLYGIKYYPIGIRNLVARLFVRPKVQSLDFYKKFLYNIYRK